MHFDCDCRLADYGFKKQIKLFEAIATTIEITKDKNGERILQLRGSEELQTAKLTNLTFSKRVQELEMASNQVSGQKDNFKLFSKQEVLEKSKLLECNKTGNTEENKTVKGNNSYKRKHYLQDYEIEATLESSKRQKTEKKIQELEIAGNEASNQAVHVDKESRKKRPAEEPAYQEESTKKQKKIRKVHNILCCGKVYSRLDYYKDHKKRAHEGITHKCGMCHVAFKWKSYLRTHMKTVHEGLRPLKCDSCELTFKTTSNLNRHIRLKHGHFNSQHTQKKIV